MFRIREFNLLPKPVGCSGTPPRKGWRRKWHGYYQAPYSGHSATKPKPGIHRNSLVERWGLLSIMEYYAGQEFTFFELGTGRGDQCLTVAGAIDHKILTDVPMSYRLLGVEAEPDHYEWSRLAFELQDIKAIMIEGAIVGRAVLKVDFYLRGDPRYYFDQSTRSPGKPEDRQDTKIRVRAFTVDQLLRQYRFERIHCIHMDIQGSEGDAIQGCRRAIHRRLIDHFIVATHGPGYERRVRWLLSPTYRCLADLPRGGVIKLPGIRGKFGVDDGTHDGVQVWRRKELH